MDIVRQQARNLTAFFPFWTDTFTTEQLERLAAKAREIVDGRK